MKLSVASDGLISRGGGITWVSGGGATPVTTMSLPPTESCTTDQSCVAEEEGDEHGSLFEGSDSSDVILKLLRLAGLTSPHQIH